MRFFMNELSNSGFQVSILVDDAASARLRQKEKDEEGSKGAGGDESRSELSLASGVEESESPGCLASFSEGRKRRDPL